MVSDEMVPGMLFHNLARVRRNAMQAELTARGFGELGAPMILFVLKHRGQEGEITVQRELADILCVSPATIAVSLKSLERDGYVEKRHDSADARRKRIALTDKGMDAVETCTEVFRTIDERMFRGFAAEETAQLIGYLRHMLQNLGADEDLKIPCQRRGPICSNN